MQKQNEVLKQEKEEAAQAFARLLETFQSTNQIAQKLGVTKSPFARTVTPVPPASPGAAPAAPTAAASAPAPAAPAPQD